MKYDVRVPLSVEEHGRSTPCLLPCIYPSLYDYDALAPTVQLALHDDRIDDVHEQNYGNYADQLDAKLAQSQSDFREAKYLAHINRNAKINANFRDVAHTRWLKPGKLVIVYRPPNRNSDAPVSSKLLMQFTGPFRIEKIVRSAVHLKNLSTLYQPTCARS